MKLKRLISCGLVGILTGVGILMNAKVSSAEDKSVKYTIASSASVTASGQVIEGSNASFKNTYSTKEQITKDNSMTFKLTNIDGIKVSKIVMKTHTNKSKGAGTIKIDIGEGNLYSGNYIKSFSTSYSDYEFDVKALKNVDYMFGDISIVMSCTVNSLYCQSYTIYYFEGEPTKSYPVTFYDGEAELTDLACNVEENGKITKPADPVKEGYIFDAWYKESTFDNKWDFENDIVAADTKLYAKFLPEAEVTKYNVTFKSDENTVINTVTVKEGNSVGEPENPVKDGYQFDGWYTDVNCTDKYDFNTVVSADLTLYAKWLAKYTVSFDTDGGSTVESQTITLPTKDLVTAPNGVGNLKNFTDGTNSYEAGETVTISSKTTIKAIYDIPSSLTVKQALDICASAGEAGTSISYTVRGTVKTVTDISTQYKNTTFVITDGTNDLTIFRADLNGSYEPKVGDVVEATGPLVNYKGNTPEMTKNGSLRVSYKLAQAQPKEELKHFVADMDLALNIRYTKEEVLSLTANLIVNNNESNTKYYIIMTSLDDDEISESYNGEKTYNEFCNVIRKDLELFNLVESNKLLQITLPKTMKLNMYLIAENESGIKISKSIEISTYDLYKANYDLYSDTQKTLIDKFFE